MTRAESTDTLELLRNRISGDAAGKLKAFTAAQVENLRPRVVVAHDRYQSTNGEKAGDEIIDGLVYVASQRSGSGSNMPFARALDQVLSECREVA